MKQAWLALWRPQAWRLGSLELLLARAMFAWVIYAGFFGGISQASQSIPVGLAHFMDLTWMTDWDAQHLVLRVWMVCAVLFVAGVVPLLSCGGMLAVMAAWGGLRCSYGNIHHGTQIASMVMLGFFLAYLWRLYSERGRRPGLGRRLLWADRRTQAGAWWWGLQAAASTYVMAGISKLEISGWSWLTQLPNMSLHVEKLGLQHYLGTGEKHWMERAEEYASVIAAHPILTIVVVGSGLFFELFAFMALYSRVHAAVFGVSLIAMHLIIIEVMQLEFPLNSWVLAVFFVNLPFVLAWLARKLGAPDDRPPPGEDVADGLGLWWMKKRD